MPWSVAAHYFRYLPHQICKWVALHSTGESSRLALADNLIPDKTGLAGNGRPSRYRISARG